MYKHNEIVKIYQNKFIIRLCIHIQISKKVKDYYKTGQYDNINIVKSEIKMSLDAKTKTNIQGVHMHRYVPVCRMSTLLGSRFRCVA